MRVARIEASDLRHVERHEGRAAGQHRTVRPRTPANNVLLTGARGTGKSSLIRACLSAFASQGLRLIEVDKRDLVDLPDIVACVAERSERFIVFCDDLSFEEGEGGYKALKAMLDGSVAAAGDNLLIYATSNRRHLMPEYMRENLAPATTKTVNCIRARRSRRRSRCRSASGCGCRSTRSARTTTWTSLATGCVTTA